MFFFCTEVAGRVEGNELCRQVNEKLPDMSEVEVLDLAAGETLLPQAIKRSKLAPACFQ